MKQLITLVSRKSSIFDNMVGDGTSKHICIICPTVLGFLPIFAWLMFPMTYQVQNIILKLLDRILKSKNASKMAERVWVT